MKKRIAGKYVSGSMVATLAGFIVYYFYRRSPAYKNYFHFINKMQAVPDNLQLINLGTTAAYYAFDYGNLNVRAMNMATYTQTFQYDLKILKKYEEKLGKNAVVLISIEYFVFLCPKVPSWRKEVYNQFLNLLESEGKTFKETFHIFFIRNFPFLFRNYHQSILNMIKMEEKYGKSNNFTIYEQNRIINQKLNALWGGAGISKEDLFSNKLTPEVKKKIADSKNHLGEMIDFCISKDWNPVFVILPYSFEMNKRFSKQLLDEICYNNLNEFVKKGVSVLDYSHNERLASSKLYMDMEYLNLEGRRRFTNIVMQDLKKTKILD